MTVSGRCFGGLGFSVWLSLLLLSPAWSAPDASAPASDRPPVKAKVSAWEESAPTAVGSGPMNTAFSTAFPDRQWWLKFNDRHLEGYISEAVRNNPHVEASVQRIAQARAEVSQNIARQLPSLSLNPGFTRIGLPSNISGFGLPDAIKLFMMAFQPSFELDLFGRNRDRTRASRQELTAVEMDSRAVLVALEGEVAAAYFNLLRADVLVDLQTKNLALLKRINELKRNQYQAGLTAYDEVIRSERDVALALSAVTTQKQQQALFAHQLSVLAGRPPVAQEHLERGALADIQLPAQTETGIPADLVLRRPDILAMEHRLKRADIDVRVARKAFLPTINLSGMFSFAGGRFGDAFNSDTFMNMESASIQQPLFQGGRLRAGVKMQKARQREQVALYRQTMLVAFREVEDQLALVKSNYDNLNNNLARLGLTAHSLQLTENQQKQGLIPRLNVLQAESELLQYQQLSAQSKAETVVSTVNLFKALAGGF